MTNGLALFAYWSVHQKLNRVSSVQLSRSVSLRAFKFSLHPTNGRNARPLRILLRRNWRRRRKNCTQASTQATQ